jgi:hypothetical protein
LCGGSVRAQGFAVVAVWQQPHEAGQSAGACSILLLRVLILAKAYRGACFSRAAAGAPAPCIGPRFPRPAAGSRPRGYPSKQLLGPRRRARCRGVRCGRGGRRGAGRPARRQRGRRGQGGPRTSTWLLTVPCRAAFKANERCAHHPMYKLARPALLISRRLSTSTGVPLTCLVMSVATCDRALEWKTKRPPLCPADRGPAV